MSGMGEPDQIDMMTEHELRVELRGTLVDLARLAQDAHELQSRLDAALARDAMLANHNCGSDGCAVPDGYTKEGAAFAQKYHDLKAERDSLASRLGSALEALTQIDRLDPRYDANEVHHASRTGRGWTWIAERQVWLNEKGEDMVRGRDYGFAVEKPAPKFHGDDDIVRLAFAQFASGYIRWKCQTSPTGCCEYNAATDAAWDTCLHCGDPYERK